MQLFDCTLRDGANVIGRGFSSEQTDMILKGLTENGIRYIEMGNALGIGTPNGGRTSTSLSDDEYLSCMQSYRGQAVIGMFMGAHNTDEQIICRCAERGLDFLRIGNNSGDAKDSEQAVKTVKKYGMLAFYAMMKSYILPPDKLAEEAKRLEGYGLDAITIMDSAGTMLPDEVSLYVEALKRSVNIPVGFHGHNNLGLSSANAVAACRAGADLIDCGLMGMARSAGNLATEVALCVFRKMNVEIEGDMIGLISFIDEELMPEMNKWYKCQIKPMDLVYGYAGAHSSFGGIFRNIAVKYDVDIFKLIIEVSKINKKNPSEQLICEVAKRIK